MVSFIGSSLTGFNIVGLCFFFVFVCLFLFLFCFVLFLFSSCEIEGAVRSPLFLVIQYGLIEVAQWAFWK